MSELTENSSSIHTFRSYRNKIQKEETNSEYENEEKSILDENDDITKYDFKNISVDKQALDYFNDNGIKNVHDAFQIANILHTNKNVKEASVIYGLAFRIHTKEPNNYPLAQSLLQARLLCMLKAGLRPPQNEIDVLRQYNIPYAKYIEGISLAWKDNKGEEALRHIKNAYEEFHTGEEIDSLYLEIVVKNAPNLLDASVEVDEKIKIPRNLFMYWDNNPPPEILSNFEFHKNIKEFNFKIFNKEEASEWLYSNYGVEARSIFLTARHPAEAADFLRVHVTQVYGGWWLDADIRVRDDDALHFMLSQEAANVFLLTHNNVVHNDFYGTIPESSIGEDCLLSLYRNCYLHHGLFIAYKTGPGIFNRAINRRAWRRMQGFPVRDNIKIYNHEIFDKVIYQFDTPYKGVLPSWHAV